MERPFPTDWKNVGKINSQRCNKNDDFFLKISGFTLDIQTISIILSSKSTILMVSPANWLEVVHSMAEFIIHQLLHLQANDKDNGNQPKGSIIITMRKCVY